MMVLVVVVMRFVGEKWGMRERMEKRAEGVLMFFAACSLQRSDIIVAVIRDWIVGSVYACLLDKQHE